MMILLVILIYYLPVMFDTMAGIYLVIAIQTSEDTPVAVTQAASEVAPENVTEDAPKAAPKAAPEYAPEISSITEKDIEVLTKKESSTNFTSKPAPVKSDTKKRY